MNFEEELKKAFWEMTGLEMRKIDAERELDDVRLRESNTYFFSRIEGQEILPSDEEHDYPYCKQDVLEVRKDRYLLPEGKEAESKYYFGLYSPENDERFGMAGKCLAIYDMVTGYPDEETLYIGWLMLDNKVHHKGLANELMNVVYSCGRKAQFKYIGLCAYEVNEIGCRFWRHQGFQYDGEVKRTTGAGELRLIMLLKEL